MRWSRTEDSTRLSRIHRDAWRFAYVGVIPGLALERMIASRGEAAWQRLHGRGGKVLAVEFEGSVAGYAMTGPSRNRRFHAEGEIYELYLDPVYHGAGLGRRLFAEARRRLTRRRLKGLLVWSLTGNEMGCRFYRSLGGRPAAKDRLKIGGITLDRIAFAWA
ncbi:MAG: GNAT family N-acetyltransferase [Paracoccaceae bacterium]|nr:GNAT family N-acetyltransferase [Paracoccaceae bacterium]